MKFPNIKVGDVVGLKSDNPNSLRYYKYERAKVLEINDDQFRLERGWFSKEYGRKGFNIVISLEELEENNSIFYRERTANRLLENINKKLSNLGTSPTDVALLENINNILSSYT